MHVLLIGNGPLPPDHDRAVRQADFVVRFNHFDPRHDKRPRTDALCVSNHGPPARRFAKYRLLAKLPGIQAVSEIWYPRPTDRRAWSFLFNPLGTRRRQSIDYSQHITQRNALSDKTIVFLGENVYGRACAELDAAGPCASQKFPSSGFLALTYALERFKPPATISLSGFTFCGHSSHDWAREAAVVHRLHWEGTVEWLGAIPAPATL